MTETDAIINPVKGKNAPSLGSVAAMISSQADLDSLCAMTGMEDAYFKRVMMSKIYAGYDSTVNFSLAGPVVGAPYGVMLLETLIVWGAQNILFFGWCGSISPDVRIGDIIVPTGAFIDEGTSKHYNADENKMAVPCPDFTEQIKTALKEKGLSFHEGPVWSTDAIYRETREKVEHFQSKRCLAVEMELSALFTVGKFRNANVGGLLVVSDELSSFTWCPGFKDPIFQESRMAVAEVINNLCQIQ